MRAIFKAKLLLIKSAKLNLISPYNFLLNLHFKIKYMYQAFMIIFCRRHSKSFINLKNLITIYLITIAIIIKLITSKLSSILLILSANFE